MFACFSFFLSGIHGHAQTQKRRVHLHTQTNTTHTHMHADTKRALTRMSFCDRLRSPFVYRSLTHEHVQIETRP